MACSNKGCWEGMNNLDRRNSERYRTLVSKMRRNVTAGSAVHLTYDPWPTDPVPYLYRVCHRGSTHVASETSASPYSFASFSRRCRLCVSPLPQQQVTHRYIGRWYIGYIAIAAPICGTALGLHIIFYICRPLDSTPTENLVEYPPNSPPHSVLF